MIRVPPKPEPKAFQNLVREPGQRFLTETPHPTSRQWGRHRYWREILRLLYDAYDGVCAYSCHWISFDTGADSVEHFIPKSAKPKLAYEWSNYRLVCGRLNGRKRNFRDVLDPFRVKNGWFVIDFPSLQVEPSRHLSPKRRARVQATIDRLKLNDEGTCLKNRAEYVKDYCLGHIDFPYLRRKAPFLALELRRQRLLNRIKDMMSYPAE